MARLFYFAGPTRPPATGDEPMPRPLRSTPASGCLRRLPRSAGDLVMADVAREAADDVVDALHELDIHREGSLHIEPVGTWLSERGYEAERRTPGRRR